MRASNNIRIYSVVFGLYSFFAVLSSSLLGNNRVRGFVDSIFAMLFIILFFKQIRYRMKMLVFYFVVIILFAFAGYYSRRIYILTYALAIIASTHEVSFPKTAEAAIIGTCIASALVVGFTFVGILPDVQFPRGAHYAHAFGFGYYSALPYYLFFSFLGYIYLKKKKMRWPEIVVWGILNYGLFYYCQTRLVFYLGYISLLLYIILIKFDVGNLNHKIIKWGTAMGFPAAMFLTVLLHRSYDVSNAWMLMLNQFASARLALGKEAFERYPITLFGQYIQISNSSNHGYFYLDSGFLYSLLGYGLLFTVVVLFMYSYLFYYSCEENNKGMAIWLFCILVFSVSNNMWVTLNANPMLIAFPIIWKRNTATKAARRRSVYVKTRHDLGVSKSG